MCCHMVVKPFCFKIRVFCRHLYRVSLRGHETGMTAKNVAIVWAPNLLRSKSIETGGVAALQGVGVQGNGLFISSSSVHGARYLLTKCII